MSRRCGVRELVVLVQYGVSDSRCGHEVFPLGLRSGILAPFDG